MQGVSVKMENQFAGTFTMKTFLRFTFPTVVMMVFMSLYTIVDGMFVSRYVGSNALSAINIVYPMLCMTIGFGVMLGTGGSAIVARSLGEGKAQEARENFTWLLCAGAMLGAAFGALMLLFLEPAVRLLGSSDLLLQDCMAYAGFLMWFAPAGVLQLIFQVFFVTAGKPRVGLGLTIAAGLANVVFDYVFIVLFGMGILGAALGTAASYVVGCVVPIIYFIKPRTTLWFVRPRARMRVLWQSMSNGASEMVSNLAAGITTFLFNAAMLRLRGEDGVAAITILLYTQFLFTAAYLGFSNGAAPIISYQYGAGNHKELHKLYRMSLKVILTASVGMCLLSIAAAGPAIAIFAEKGSAVYELALRGYRIFAINFLFAGFNIYTSSLFTALSNGKASAAISFLRAFFFEAVALVSLPWLMGETGVWLAIPIAEVLTALVGVWLLRKARAMYPFL